MTSWRKLFRSLTLIAFAAAASISTFAQQLECNELYRKWHDNAKLPIEDARARHRTAYAAGKDFVAKCPNYQHASYVAAWVSKYETSLRRHQLRTRLIERINERDWAAVFTTGVQVLEEEPEDFNVIIRVLLAAVNIARESPRNEAIIEDAHRIGRQALQLVAAGRLDSITLHQLAVIGVNSKDEVIALIHSSLRALSLDRAAGSSE